jgi:predicted dehydrogenase
MGMVGGGRGAFIGVVHRMAAALDGQIELVCGAFSADPAKSKASGKDLYLPRHRVYSSYTEMFQREKMLPPGERMDCVSIVTPNHMHYPMAKMALENGFHVICDKPLAFNLKEARALAALVRKTGLVFALTHNYTGYPMVKEARAQVRAGNLGKIRKIVVEYPQGWLALPLEAAGQKQADWRTDPKRAGASCCIGDIGTHAENLAEFITGLQIDAVCAELTTFVKGRKLEDDGNVLLRFKGGAKGILYASQISCHEENGLAIRVYGEKGGLEWRQEEPNNLILKWPTQPRQILHPGSGYAYLSPATLKAARLPAGHPEGFLEAFANLYRNFAGAVRVALTGRKPSAALLDFPTVKDGVRGMAFIETVVKSAKSKQKWIPMPSNAELDAALGKKRPTKGKHR